ncbi:hypothetical protein ACFL5V_03385 [Fibrobacterota bacterium]
MAQGANVLCADYVCDSLTVRTILDSNGLNDIQVSQVSISNWDAGEFQRIHTLQLPDSVISFLPKEIGQLSELENLDISNNGLATLPEEIASLEKIYRCKPTDFFCIGLLVSGNKFCNLENNIAQWLDSSTYYDWRPTQLCEAKMIEVVFPNGDEVLFVDSIYRIDWTYTGEIDSVKIELSLGENNWLHIATVSNNSFGFYDWAVLDIISLEAKIRVSSTNGTLHDESDGTFNIQRASTSIKILERHEEKPKSKTYYNLKGCLLHSEKSSVRIHPARIYKK